MGLLIVAASFVLLICLSAYRANMRFRAENRLPMQWGFTGEVNWSAPRRLALAFMPIVAFLVLGVFGVMSFNVPPRAGQEHLVLPTLIGMGTMLVAIQRLHFWLIAKTLRRNVR